MWWDLYIYAVIQMHDRGVLTRLKTLYVVSLSVVLGYLAALAMWCTWKKMKN